MQLDYPMKRNGMYIIKKRGQIFDIEGRSFFTFGGATSHDIGGGILEPDDPAYNTENMADCTDRRGG